MTTNNSVCPYCGMQLEKVPGDALNLELGKYMEP